MRQFILILLVSAAGVGLGGGAAAGVTTSVTDTCSAEEHVAGDLTGELFTQLRGNVPGAQDDFVLHEPSGRPSGKPCARDTRIHPFNDTNGPAVGAAQEASTLGEEAVKKALADFATVAAKLLAGRQAGAMPHFECLVGRPCALPAPLQRSRGFQLRLSAGGGMQPAGTYTFLQYRPVAGDPARYSIPFVILEASPDDWLEFSMRGEVFWKTQLVDLKVGELYFVPVPEVPEHALQLLGLYLNAESGSRSVVYVPTEMGR
jgi:hypothetical protein